MNDKVMKKTQDTLGKIIQKPPLKEKLLSKPPFRFLHDIMTTVIRSTGFMAGLYQENEMISDNVKDKESKVAFLQKALDMVSLVLGKPVPARPSKIVAGHEPEKTNEFLQMLAEAIEKKVDNDEYVARVLKTDGGGGGGGGKKDKPPTGSKDRKDRETSGDRRKRKDKDDDKKKDEDGERHRSKREDREDRKDRGKSRDRERDKDRHREKGDRERSRDRSKDRGKDEDKEKDREKDRERRHRDRDKSRDGREDRDKDRERRRRKDKEREEGEEETQQVNGDDREERVRGTSRGRPSPKTSRADKTKASPSRGDKTKDSSSRGDKAKASPSRGDKAKASPSRGDKAKASPSRGAKAKASPSRGDKTKASPSRGEKSRELERGKDSKDTTKASPPDEASVDKAPHARIPRPASAKGARRRHRDGRILGDESSSGEEEETKEEKPKKREESTMNGNLGEDDLPPQVAASRRLARPSSARPAPPRVKKQEQEPQEVHIVGQSNVPNVIVDKKGSDSEDEEENFITKEDPLVVDEPPPPPVNQEIDEEGGEHGGLVKKMLESKKELEGGSTIQNKTPKKTEIERSQVTDATKRKEREMVQKEIDKLRAAIQLLTRSANPLGKIMDFVQEDLDSMQKEMTMWSREHKENVTALQREQNVTESSIEPLKAQLKELDSAVSDQLDLIAAVKANILRNDDKMEKMLSSITKS